ncbi:hypothetical protein ACMFMG_006828 [Clarireedia jacksonii]
MSQLPPRLRCITEHAGTVKAGGEHHDVVRFISAPSGPKPTEHLSVLRNPYHRLSHCDGYLSPALHNISPTYVRLLERDARSLAEADYEWAEFLKHDASTFTLGVVQKHAQIKQEKVNAIRRLQEMDTAAERGDSYRYTPDYGDYGDSDSDDDDEDAYDHLSAIDGRSSSTNTSSSSVGSSSYLVMKSSTRFYNMPELSTSNLALSVDDRFRDSGDQEHNTPRQSDELRGIVGSSGNFLHSSDVASSSMLAETQLPLIYPDLPMPPSNSALGWKTPRFTGVNDESGDLALQTPQFALDLNERLDRALYEYKNTALSPIKDGSPVLREASIFQERD